MSSARTGEKQSSNAYQIFILVLTLLSLGIMVLLVLPWVSQPTKDLLNAYDNMICFIFLLDFALNMRRASSKRHYFIEERGWLDLLGSIPSLGFIGSGQYASLFRLARLSRLARIARLFRGNARQMLVDDLVHNRGQYAVFITILSAFIVLVVASVTVLQFESTSPDANIKTGGEALWWGIVTITTVGYGDFYPVTMGGRLTAALVMFAGVGIIGSLASILASVLVSSGDEEAAEEAPPSETLDGDAGLRQELSAVRDELRALREALTERTGRGVG